MSWNSQEPQTWRTYQPEKAAAYSAQPRIMPGNAVTAYYLSDYKGKGGKWELTGVPIIVSGTGADQLVSSLFAVAAAVVLASF